MSSPLASGSRNGLGFEIAWSTPEPTGDAVAATAGSLFVRVGDEVVWGIRTDSGERKPIEWRWIELLEFLSSSWMVLKYERGYPASCRPDEPSQLRQTARSRWETVPDDIADREEEDIFAFEENHDLSRALHGAFVPSLWLVREGDLFTVGTEKTTVHQPAEEVLNTLRALGESIAQRLTAIADRRAKDAITAWRHRESTAPQTVIALATGYEVDELRRHFAGRSLARSFRWKGADPSVVTEPMELVGVTRGLLSLQQVKPLLEMVQRCPRRSIPKLDQWDREIRPKLSEWSGKKRFEQGYELALWLREQPEVANHVEGVDPEVLLTSLGVTIESFDFGMSQPDAVACWGASHGPIVIINNAGKHQSSLAARRMTLAHELCHLLVDRTGALPLAEAVNGNVPRWAERRANAFAAELLLPRAMAADHVRKASDIESAVRQLKKKFGVSNEVAARQVRNSGVLLNTTEFDHLRSLVSDPLRF